MRTNHSVQGGCFRYCCNGGFTIPTCGFTTTFLKSMCTTFHFSDGIGFTGISVTLQSRHCILGTLGNELTFLFSKRSEQVQCEVISVRHGGHLHIYTLHQTSNVLNISTNPVQLGDNEVSSMFFAGCNGLGAFRAISWCDGAADSFDKLSNNLPTIRLGGGFNVFTLSLDPQTGAFLFTAGYSKVGDNIFHLSLIPVWFD